MSIDIFHQLKKFGKDVYPYTLFDAVKDNDGKTLTQRFKDLILAFKKLESNVESGILKGDKGDIGESGKSPELRLHENMIQWRLDGEEEWSDLFSVIDIIPDTTITDENGNVVDLNDYINDKINGKFEGFITDDLIESNGHKALSVKKALELSDKIDSVYEYIKENIESTCSGENGKDGENGRSPEFIVENNILKWRLEGDEYWNDLFNIPELTDTNFATEEYVNNSYNDIINWINSNVNLDGGKDGENGRSPEFIVDDNIIKWRLVGDEEWITLATLPSGGGSCDIEVIDSLDSYESQSALSANQGRILSGIVTTIYDKVMDPEYEQGVTEIKMDKIQFRTYNNILQFKYESELDWTDLVELEELLPEINLDIPIINSLDSNDTQSALSAYQGKILNDNLFSLMKIIESIPTDDNDNTIIDGCYSERIIEMRSSETHLQWKYEDEDENYWRNIIALEDITKAQLEIKVEDTLYSDNVDAALSANQGRLLNETLNKLFEIVNNYIEIEGVEVVNNLEDSSFDKALSANQGKILNERMNILEKKLEVLEGNITRLSGSLFSPGCINEEGFLSIEPEEWTSNDFIYVDRNSSYIINCNHSDSIRCSFYGIANNEIVFNSMYFELGSPFIRIEIPSDVYYIKIGFGTKQPNDCFLNYELKKI